MNLVKPVLMEIRLRRSERFMDEEPVDDRDHLWVPDTPYQRARLTHAVERGTRLFGERSHWIEERRA
ncbi:MAG: hypothetical protein KKC85_19015 [Gammaproteobacteria bacterium]|nr:hypothetical protein [Gammaproteobacteria bacterium]MBU1442118.1 hypothetical protein [Gammaproteobacteria bacterium]MBU2288504.1 hypothetical protein [Gammaproteobacteria bacterium]